MKNYVLHSNHSPRNNIYFPINQHKQKKYNVSRETL